MAANADIPGLVSDKDFLGLPPAQQRNVLFRVTGDDSFNKLGDGETMQFIQGVQPRSVASPIPAPSVANTPGLGQVPQPNMPPTLGNLPSPKGMMAQQTQPSPAVGALALGGAAALGGAPVAAGIARLPIVGPTIKAAVRAIPYVAASEGINYARQNLPLGKYIPAAADMLPLFMAGGKEEESPSTRQPRVQYGPENPGREFLKKNKGVFPGAPYPETPTPEQLNPSLISPARSTPGQVGSERIYGPRPTPARPIPARQGLMLRGDVDTSVYPGAPFPKTPAPEQINPSLLSESRSLPGQVGKETVWRKGTAAEPIPARKGLALPPAQMDAMEQQLKEVPTGNLPKTTGDPYKLPRTPDKMEMVDSTNVQKIGHDTKSNTMVVEYRNGKVYEYRGVPKEIYQQAKDAESVGSFISRNIKGRYGTTFRGSVLPKKY